MTDPWRDGAGCAVVPGVKEPVEVVVTSTTQKTVYEVCRSEGEAARLGVGKARKVRFIDTEGNVLYEGVWADSYK